MSEGTSASQPVDRDEMDLKLIDILDSHPRMTYTDLAVSLGVSRPTARAMVRRLAKEWGLKTVCQVDYRALGYEGSTLLCINAVAGSVMDVAKGLASLPEILFVMPCTGPFDVICWSIFREGTEIRDLLSTGLGKVPGISRCETVVCHLPNISPLSGDAAAKAGCARASAAPLDGLDIALIGELRRNGRESVTALAAKLDSSRSTVARKMERLVDDGVIRFVTFARRPGGKRRGLACAGIKVSPARIKDVGEALATRERVQNVHVCTGRYDVVAWISFANLQELFDFLTAELGTIPGILSIETSISLGTLKAS